MSAGQITSLIFLAVLLGMHVITWLVLRPARCPICGTRMVKNAYDPMEECPRCFHTEQWS